MPDRNSNRVCVVVLGDIGRSPRMQYHAFSLRRAGAVVDVAGYFENHVFPAIASQEGIRWHRIRQFRRAPHRLLFLPVAALKVVCDALQLFWILLARIERPDVILVQNPPAIPSLAVVWFAARLRGAKFAIDWHNFGHSMLALKLGADHPLVAASRWFERFVSRRADTHLCVSEAMRRLLERESGISATVLYDCPPGWFGREPAARREEFLREILNGPVPDSAGLVISPSSWTGDEDYALLLDGIRRWDERHESGEADPVRLIVLLTGKGPLRARFEEEIARLALRRAAIRTLWVEPVDYPRLLGIADAGICVHSSSSGVDLPMKIADMFGSGLPVLAFDYGPCLRERLEPGVTGLCFRTADELASHLHELFPPNPAGSALLNQLRANVLAHGVRRWEDEWTAVARPLLLT